MSATPAWPPKSAPRLFVDEPLTEGADVRVEGNQAHYLGKVMRIAQGDTVILCDNKTGEWAAEVVEAGKRHVLLKPQQHLRPREEVPDFWLCAALLKKDRFDMVLEKATELGVDRIQPVVPSRCVADKKSRWLEPHRSQNVFPPRRRPGRSRCGCRTRPACKIPARPRGTSLP